MNELKLNAYHSQEDQEVMFSKDRTVAANTFLKKIPLRTCIVYVSFLNGKRYWMLIYEAMIPLKV